VARRSGLIRPDLADRLEMRHAPNLPPHALASSAVHCTHVAPLHTGVVPPQALASSAVHCTHVAPLHTGVSVPAHCALLVHDGVASPR
jgi:hypothetical protein